MSSRKVAGANIFLSLPGVQTLAVTSGCQQHELLQQQHLLLQCYLLKPRRVQDLDGCVVMPSTSGKHCHVCAAPFSTDRAGPVLLASIGRLAMQKGATCGPSLILLKAQIPAVQKGIFTRRLRSCLPILISSTRSQDWASEEQLVGERRSTWYHLIDNSCLTSCSTVVSVKPINHQIVLESLINLCLCEERARRHQD